ncbi:hypothetical protein [Sphaerisporangium aureirubrum]|uniref:Serine/threonine protein kinase n=1 Tax=Sphaerisporangium aureirubrum TaxID=1544736 RepID=A0ABW1NEL9_9ACTN
MKRLGPFHTLAAGVVFTAALAALTVGTTPASEPTAANVEAPRAEPTTASTDRVVPEPTATPTAAADPTPKRADYAGVAQRNGGLIAISVKNGKAVAYFCDGRIEAWLKGTAQDNTITLTGKNSVITAALGDGKAQGRVQVGSGKWRFAAPLVKKPSGLYRATAVVRGARVVGGWIKLPDGQQVGVVNIAGTPSPAPTLTPGSPVTVGGEQIVPQDTDAFIDEF